MTNEERAIYDNIVNMKELHDELVRNKDKRTFKDTKVTWPVFKTKITFDTSQEFAQSDAIEKYMNNRGIEGTYADLMLVGRLGVQDFYLRRKK